ncbi:unnamed protein product [Blepharisma stoltei]|uniref:RING-type domain-containing protein n=1 Tax=Blepharisma stoltei TaxID=1481888 RepID=A0AAU9IYY3_9CILI|nr:unnamed protein product [Blepharisma stoltei]
MERPITFSFEELKVNQGDRDYCPYCEQDLTGSELHHHLDCCEVYESLINRSQTNSRRSTLIESIANNLPHDLSNSDEELPFSMHYMANHSNSSSLSSLGDNIELPPIPSESRDTSPAANLLEFNRTNYAAMPRHNQPALPQRHYFRNEALRILQTNHRNIHFPSRELNATVFSFQAAKGPKEAPKVYPLRPSSKQGRNIGTCPVCFEIFNQAPYSPLLLPSCGHTICIICLQNMYEDSSILKCPVCRTMSFNEIESLPVNYAILEIAEAHKMVQKETCPKHKHEIVGYCKDHEMLLCGACVFEHKDHNAFMLTDPKASEVADSKKALINEQEKELQAIQNKWLAVMQDLNTNLLEINQCGERHIEGLKKAEKLLIKGIKDGTKACIEQVTNLIKGQEIQKLQTEISDQISGIRQTLNELKDKKERFEGMGIVEKLCKPATQMKPEDVKVPSLEPAKQLITKLKIAVKYEDAIKKSNFPIGGQ